MMVSPAFSMPDFSASSTIRNAIRSFTEPPALKKLAFSKEITFQSCTFRNLVDPDERGVSNVEKYIRHDLHSVLGFINSMRSLSTLLMVWLGFQVHLLTRSGLTNPIGHPLFFPEGFRLFLRPFPAVMGPTGILWSSLGVPLTPFVGSSSTATGDILLLMCLSE